MQEIHASKENFVPNGGCRTEDASDGIYGTLSEHGRCERKLGIKTGQMTYRSRVNVRFPLLGRHSTLALRGLSPWTRRVKLVAPPRRRRGGGALFRLFSEGLMVRRGAGVKQR